MAETSYRRKRFHGLDFATRTIATWIGAWLPIWILFDSCDVEMPIALLPVTVVLAAILKIFSYGPAKRRKTVIFAVVGAVLVFALVQFEQTADGFRVCFNAISDSINSYYGFDIGLMEIGSRSTYGTFLFMLLISTILMLLSDLASEGRSWIPWLAVSFLFPWIAILVDAFSQTWYLCLYAGLIVYFTLTAESHVMKVAAGARYRSLIAIGVTVMFILANLIISEKTYDEKLRNWEGRQAIGDYLTEHFPILFGRNSGGKSGDDASGLSNGVLPKSGHLQYNGTVVGTVTLPQNYGTLYLRTNAYGEYTGSSWVTIDDYMNEYGADSTRFEFAKHMPTDLERLYLNYQGDGADDIRFSLRCVPIEIFIDRDDTFVAIPYNSYCSDEFVSYTGEACAVFPEGGSHGYTVMCYNNVLQLPGCMSYAADLKKPTETDVPLDEMTRLLMNEYETYVYGRYLVIPESCSRVEGLLTRELGETEFDCILKVQEFLNYGYAYTTRPGETPDGEDFIEYFLLKNKKGYCSYYASAAVMLFRSLGIPARYVEGYSVESGIIASSPITDKRSVTYHDEKGGMTSVSVDYVTLELTEQYAHAWVEVYLDGYGWYPVEVTNSTGQTELERSLYAASLRERKATPSPAPITKTPTPKPTTVPGGKVSPAPKPTATPGGKVTPTPVPGESGPSEGERNSAEHLKTLFHVLLVLVILAMPIVFIGLRYRHKQRIRYKQTHRNDVNAAFVNVCREIGRVLRLRGLQYDRYEGDSAYLARAGAAYGHAEEFAWLCLNGNRAAYSGERLTTDDRADALALYRKLRKEALEERNLPKRLWLKYIRII
ncbi:MAG: transglutaminase domain-containing protein [Lachnospiraceae bacterium]|nr:transglutaminase domain-containing protein [Lachnospiraceae bacterium]